MSVFHFFQPFPVLVDAGQMRRQRLPGADVVAQRCLGWALITLLPVWVSWVVQAWGGAMPTAWQGSLHAGSSVCFPSTGGINRKDCSPKPLISSSLSAAFEMQLSLFCCYRRGGFYWEEKNALSKEGEEDILALGRCSVLPLILTLAWRAFKPSGCLVGGASAAAGLDMVPGRQQILLHCGPLHHLLCGV